MDRSTEALVTLLFDDDAQVAVQAMEQLIKDHESLQEILSIYQDSTDPHVRKRIHQISSVLSRRIKKAVFIKNMKSTEGSLINNLIQLTSLTNPRVFESAVREEFKLLVLKLNLVVGEEAISTEVMVDFMRSEHFFVPETFTLEDQLLHIDAVLNFKLGSAIILSALAYSLGKVFKWQVKLVIHDGIFCLLDNSGKLISPNLSWKITQLEDLNSCVLCKDNELIFNVISNHFLIAIQDGEIKNIHMYGELLTELFDSKIENMPYPIGPESN